MGTVKSHVLIGAFFLVYAACEGTAYAEAAAADPAIDADNLREALVEGDPELNLRFRTEHVDQEGQGDASATSLRTTLAYRTKPLSGFSVFAEVEDVRVIGNDALYNDGGSNSITDRAVIADPEGTEINQALHQRCHHADGGTPGSHSSRSKPLRPMLMVTIKARLLVRK